MCLDWNEFTLALPKEERLIFNRLREFVLETDPRLIETNNYGVPYYSRHRRICFIWPVSAPDAPTAKNQKQDGTLVSLGFCYGNLLSNDQGLLLAEGRKQVYIIRFRSLSDFTSNEKQIAEILNEAIFLDQVQKTRAIRNSKA